MNWDAIGAVGELLGALGVIITLAYLALQVRQNSNALRSSTRSDIARTQLEINFILARDPDLAMNMYALLQGEELSDRERVAAEQYVAGALRTFENQYYAYREGSFPGDVWVGYRQNILFLTQQPAFAAFWHERRHLFSSDFAAFLDALAENPDSPGS